MQGHMQELIHTFIRKYVIQQLMFIPRHCATFGKLNSAVTMLINQSDNTYGW